jgi:tetratricopeptide (TPR) repeat protein/HEAT repeat protein
MTDAERQSIGWFVALGLLFAFGAGLGIPTSGSAEQGAEGGDWEVEGGEKRVREVVRRYKKLLEKKPTQGVIFEKLVEYVGKGDGLERLIEEYRTRVEESPDEANLRLILGHLLETQGRKEEAMTHYDEAVELAGEDSVVWMSRGRLHSEMRHREKATEDFEKALEYVDKRTRKQDVLRKLADLAFEQHDWDRATSYYDRLIELDPRNEYLRMEYAQVLVEHRRYDKAIEQYENLLNLAGNNPKEKATTLRDLGDVYQKKGDDEQAVETFREAMDLMRRGHWLHEELQQRVIDVYRQNDRLADLVGEYEQKWGRPGYERTLLLGELNDEIGRGDQALAQYRRASRLRRSATKPREQIIQILRRRGEDKKVIEAYRELTRVAPEESRYQFELVELYLQLGNREEATDMLERIGRVFRGQPAVYSRLADTYMRYEMEDEALETYRALVEMAPNNESYILSLGESYYRSGKVEKAVETWKRLLESSLDEADAHARLGQVYAEHGMIERGVRHYRNAVELRPDDLSIRRGLASTYERARRWKKAVEVWEQIMDETDQTNTRAEARGRIISIYKQQHRLRSKLTEFAEQFDSEPPDTEAGYFLAEGHMKMNNYEKAEETYRKLIEADDKVAESDVEAYRALERIYRQTRELEKAVEVLQELAELQPERQRDYYHKIAELSLKLYEDDQAVKYAALAVEKNPDDADARARLGEVYRQMQRLEAAVEEYRRALDLDPKAHRHAMKLAEILIELGERARAEELYRRVARQADESSMVLDAGRRAIELADAGGRLHELEREFAQLAFQGGGNGVYRKIMLEVYERMVTPMMLSIRYGVDGEQPKVREQMREIGERASPVLMAAVGGDDIGQRALAVRLLGGLEHDGAALQLARMATDPKESLRTLAAISVAEIGDPRAAGPLVQGLAADDPKMRELATWALGYVGGDQAVGALVDQLDTGQNWTERALGAIGLGRVGGERARKALEQAMRTVPPGESNDGLLVAVTWALGEIGDGRSVEVLSESLRRSPGDVRYMAATALAEVGNEEAVRALLEARWDDRRALHDPAMRGLVKVATQLESDEDKDGVADEQGLLADTPHIDERNQKVEVPGLVSRRKVAARVVGVTEADVFFDRYAGVVAEEAESRLGGGEDVASVVLGDLWRSGRLRLGSLEPEGDEARSRYGGALADLEGRLADLAASDSPEVAAPAVGLFGHVGQGGNLELLVERLGAGSGTVRSAAARALGDAGAPGTALGRLVEVSDEADFVMRRAVCRSIGEILGRMSAESDHRDRAFDVLEEALDDEYRSVRVSAIRGLGRAGGERPAKLLANRLDGLAVPLKSEALSVLAGMEHEAAQSAVDSYRDHPDFRLRRAVSN